MEITWLQYYIMFQQTKVTNQNALYYNNIKLDTIYFQKTQRQQGITNYVFNILYYTNFAYFEGVNQ